MENSTNVLTGKRLLPVFHRIPGMIILSLCLCACPSISTAVSIWPTEIKFDYEPGYNNDALNIRLDADQDVQIPEWILYGRHYECAYIKGQSNRKIQVRFDSDTDNTNFLIKATVYTGVGIGSVCEAFVADCEIDENDWITLFISGSVPSSVGIRTFVWKWEATALPMSSPYCPVTCNPVYTEHTYFTLLAEPQEPMPEPWTSVLNYACDWAANQSTAANVAQKVTEGIYYMGDTDGDIDYDWPAGECKYSRGSYNREFNLTNFLNDIWSSNAVKVNCSDVANLFNILSAAVGLTSSNKIIIQYDYPGYFQTNLIDPIGDIGWKTATWFYHHFGWYNSSVDDPCLEVNHDNPILPSNMIQGIYENYLISTGYGYSYSDTGITTIYH